MRNLLLVVLIGSMGVSWLLPVQAAQAEPEGYSAQEQANLDAARQGVDAFVAGDMEGFFALLADDIVWEVNGSSAIIPMHGRYEGIEAVRAWFDGMSGVGEVVDFSADHFFVDGDTVIMLVHARDRSAETGAEFEQRCAAFMTFSDGKLAHFLLFDDSALEYLMLQSATLAESQA